MSALARRTDDDCYMCAANDADFNGGSCTRTKYQYDLNGNLTEDAQNLYQWDAENRLIRIDHKSSGRVSQFRYDGLSRRIAIIEQAPNTTAVETRYRWCGDWPCQIRDGSDAVIGHYYEQGEVHSAQPAYYARDHLGSVLATVDANGNPKATAEYTAYGRTLSSLGTQPDFAYAGMLRHKPSGLYLTQYRAYDPNSGRWLSRDPIQEQGGINLYTYVGNRPTALVDPTGTRGIAGGACFGIVLGAIAFEWISGGMAANDAVENQAQQAVRGLFNEIDRLEKEMDACQSAEQKLPYIGKINQLTSEAASLQATASLGTFGGTSAVAGLSLSVLAITCTSIAVLAP